MLPGAQPIVYLMPQAEDWSPVDGAVIEETAVCLFVNGREMVTLMASPIEVEALALGFLYTEGFIHSMDDVAALELSRQGACVDVWLHSDDMPQPRRVIRTSGCSGGVTFDDLTAAREPTPVRATLTAQQVIDRYFDLRSIEQLYPLARGVHGSALCTADDLLLWTEDVGRHNTLDKLAGKALQQHIPTGDRAIVTTGRISSEMLGKAAKLGVSVIASRTSPTHRSVALAHAWNITIIGYIRRDSFRLYTAPSRIVPADPAFAAIAATQAAPSQPDPAPK
ncbi:MAG: formate dehydrogenase accessory sulfurtransferase FdhD [Caldilineaceae bacterium]|nr:formate dehydrogenase accessory sulfurtransferase FdhD [Caldilineaceae bacterium]